MTAKNVVLRIAGSALTLIGAAAIVIGGVSMSESHDIGGMVGLFILVIGGLPGLIAGIWMLLSTSGQARKSKGFEDFKDLIGCLLLLVGLSASGFVIQSGGRDLWVPLAILAIAALILLRKRIGE